jgi:hypothetical protein
VPLPEAVAPAEAVTLAPLRVKFAGSATGTDRLVCTPTAVLETVI